MQLKSITKKYNQNAVLDHLDFEFGTSRIVGLIGKNGVGKTTLMKIMNRNIVKYSGEVVEQDDNRIGYLIEHPKLYDNKSGMYNLKFFAKVLGKGYDKAYTEEIIQAFGMESYMNKKVKKYSMGMKQKLAIAVSLMNKPHYLILDEPTNGMDPDGSIDVLETIKKLAVSLDMKILISSHKLEDIELICDRSVFLRDGKFAEDVDMSTSAPTTKTVLRFKSEDYKAACTLLAEANINLFEQNDATHIVSIDQQQDFHFVLRHLGASNIYPLYIETVKASLRDTYFNINQRGDKS